MRAMVLTRPGEPLRMPELAERAPGAGEIGLRVTACGVCRTDLHMVDGELPDPKLPLSPGLSAATRQRSARRLARGTAERGGRADAIAVAEPLTIVIPAEPTGPRRVRPDDRLRECRNP